jgi:CHAT domain-containing protein/tetratricopeptide (TPR) repeat protein
MLKSILRIICCITLGVTIVAAICHWPEPAGAQSVDDLDALNRRVQKLHQSGNYGEAISAARRYVIAAKQQHGEEHAAYVTAISWLAGMLQETNRLTEAEPLLRRALRINEKLYHREHPSIAVSLSNLAVLLMKINRAAEAEPMIRRALAIDEKSLGPHHPTVAIRLGNLAALLSDTYRPAEAEPLERRALAIAEKNFGPSHPDVALRLNNLAQSLQATNRLAEAERLMRRTLALYEKSLGPNHPSVAIALNNLARLLEDTNRLTEADALMRRALAINERRLGPGHPTVAISLSNLAMLLREGRQFAEAELLMRRALAINEKSFGPDHPSVARDLNNLALLLQDANRLAEAESLLRRALAINEKSFGRDHPNVAQNVSNLALLLRSIGRTAEAEPLMRRALAINEMNHGPNHPGVAAALNDLALLFTGTGRSVEAEALYRRALAIDGDSLGPVHPRVAIRLNNLAVLLGERGDWGEAVELGRRALPIMTGGDAEGRDRTTFGKAQLVQSSQHFRAYARALHRVGAARRESQGKAFEVAQWALQTSAADALAQMAARVAKGAGPLADLVREHQDLLARRRGDDRRLLAAIGRGDARATGEIRTAIAALDAKLDSIDKRLGREFKVYAELVAPKPLGIAHVQALLKSEEVLILFLDVPRIGKLSEESLVWAIAKTEVRWARIELGTKALREQVRALRCGLDADAWTDGRCRDLLKVAYTTADRRAGKPPPFDHSRAHALYRGLFGPFEDMIADKHLLVVPSGPLTMLPFAALVTAPAADDVDNARVAWLGSRQSITLLPSVASLAAVRAQARRSSANKLLIGFGNPLLDGDPAIPSEVARASLARKLQRCPGTQQTPTASIAEGPTGLRPLGRGGLADPAKIRSLSALPETAAELCVVAQSLGVPASEIRLGAQATERELKAMSADGRLAGYRIVHLATHGAVAGELEPGAEPGLVLTPPSRATEIDDGYLTASEIAGLKLDADWVILSACNTAAGGAEDAEALSGLARAFFYAGARSLLLSHWAVDSRAAAQLVTSAVSAMAADPDIGRAEALQRSMRTLIGSGVPLAAHPAYWAPFMVVGEGAR